MKIYWQNLDALSCGWFESELASKQFNNNQDFEIGIEQQTYDLRVLEGFYVIAPKEVQMLETCDVAHLHRIASNITKNASLFANSVSDESMTYSKDDFRRMRQLRENIYKQITKYITLHEKKLRTVK